MYSVTGGLGGLGLVAAAELALSATETVALISRSTRVESAGAVQISDCISSRAASMVISCDVSHCPSVADMNTQISLHGLSLRGVLHAAGLATLTSIG